MKRLSPANDGAIILGAGAQASDIRVTEQKVESWVDDDQIVNVEHAKHRLSIWWEQEPVRPFEIGLPVGIQNPRFATLG